MSSGADVASDARSLAENLTRFAYNPDQKHSPNGQQASNVSSATSRATGKPCNPPAQSRDATNSSRFFTAIPANGTVLVPDSSPLSKESTYQPYRPYQYSNDAASMVSSSHHNSWGQSLKNRADPLSRPSGFVASTDANNAPITRRSPPSGRRPIDLDEGFDHERPRKRVNIDDTSSEPFDVPVPGSPPSPDIVRPGQKRRLVTNKSSMLSSSLSSDEHSLDRHAFLTGSPKPRLVRGGGSDEKALVALRMCHPQFPPSIVDAVYHSVGGHPGNTTKILNDPNFDASMYKSSSSVSTPSSVRVVGKVKEVEEEREAQRAQQKQIASKSSIYKNRAIIDSPTPSSSSLPTSPLATVDPDPSPVRPKPARLKSRRQIVDSASENESESEDEDPMDRFEKQALRSFNSLGSDALRELTGCTDEQVAKIMSLRPFQSVSDLKKRLGQDKKKAGPADISPRLFEECVEIYEGYGNVDKILKDCERIGMELKKAIAAWTKKSKGKEREDSPALRDLSDDGALAIASLSGSTSTNSLLTKAPSLLAPGVQLKDYQLTGVNWLRLLHSKGYSCILADEMGLGKTVQVISFFAQLKEQGCAGPHLVVVPSSTLENWCREFERFAPSITIETYYGNKNDRPFLRDKLQRTYVGKESKKGKNWEVLITTYNLAVGDSLDKKFFRRIPWNTCVFDEGHVLKNFQSQRYTTLTRIDAEWKLLLTGTPLQNNLQELVSVMGFILPDKFGDEVAAHLRAIFKVKGDTKLLLAEERVKRAKTMMTPFVLRRRKDQVLKDLPNKTERIEWCSLSPLQANIYNDARQRSRKTIMDQTTNGTGNDDPNAAGSRVDNKALRKVGKSNGRGKDKKYLENTSNVLMELRKAASHPMLFRTHFTDDKLTSLTRVLLKEPDFKKRGAIFEYVKEDMEVMTDSELQAFCRTYKSTQKFLLDETCYLESGKIKTMLNLLDRYISQGRKCLIFSQFTQILDILQVVLKQRSVKYLVLTGSTAVDVRQGLVDEFTEDESIPVFLLSTKAGGMGINLTAASVVILFDQDFNPHNDRQAADRAYRIGQKRDVEVVKLISRGTIEEDMFRLGQTKLALDEAVAGDAEEGDGDSKAEKVMRTSLMETLRKQFEAEDNGDSKEIRVAATTNGAGSPGKRERKTATSNGLDASPKKKGQKSIPIDVVSDESELTDLESS
ncbi:FUN30 [Sanghuangporus weigelae]